MRGLCTARLPVRPLWALLVILKAHPMQPQHFETDICATKTFFGGLDTNAKEFRGSDNESDVDSKGKRKRIE